MNGADLPVFDFGAPGVSSMSADLHKYGYCLKGASAVFLCSEELRPRMIFEVRDWPAGKNADGCGHGPAGRYRRPGR